MTGTAGKIDGRDWGLLVLLSVLWGGSFFFAGVAVRELPPLTIVMARVVIAALLLLPVFFYFGYRLPRTWEDWRPFFWMGVLNNVLPFSLMVTGQVYIASGTTAIINATTPLFGVIVMATFREEALTWPRVTGVLMGLAGVVILRGADASVDYDQTIGLVLVLAGALSYGFAGLWGRRMLAGAAPVKSATCQLLCSGLVMVVLACVFEQPWTLPMPSVATWGALIGLAALATALAYLIFFQILVRSGASNVMLVTLLVPVSAVALGIWFLDEPLVAREMIGALVICTALLVIDGRILGWIRGK